jgi:hypothetical protein
MDLTTTQLRPALSAYLRSLDGRGARKHRRASERLADAHRAYQHEVAMLLQRRAWAADAAERVDIAVVSDRARSARRTYCELAAAERRPRRAWLRRSAVEDRRELALRYAAASMELDAAIDETTAQRLTR